MPPRLLGLCLACMALLSACPDQGPEVVDFEVIKEGNVRVYPVGERRAAPTLQGELLTGGGAFDPATVKGKVVVVNFWASWCGPCRDEQPLLKDLSERYRSKGVRFVGVNNRRDQRAAALSFLEEFKMWEGEGEPVYPSIYDPRSKNAFAYRLFFMPATIVVDEQARIAAFIAGGVPSEESLTAILEAEVA